MFTLQQRFSNCSNRSASVNTKVNEVCNSQHHPALTNHNQMKITFVEMISRWRKRFYEHWFTCTERETDHTNCVSWDETL